MPRQPDPQIKIASLRTAAAVLAFARNADPRSVADTRRNPNVDGARMAVMLDRQPAHRPVVGVFQSELDFLFDVTAGARTSSAPTARPRLVRGGAAAAEERLEEIRERISAFASEHLVQFFLRHGAVAGAAAAEIDVPSAALPRIEALARSRLLVGAPVRAKLVVLLALRGIAEH